MNNRSVCDGNAWLNLDGASFGESILERILDIYYSNPLRSECCWQIGKELKRSVMICKDGAGRYMVEPNDGEKEVYLLGLRLSFSDESGIRLVNDDTIICPQCGRKDKPYESGNCRGCGFRRRKFTSDC